MISLFITGTDTNVGKTYASLGLLRCFRAHRLQTLALKPIASGCYYQGHMLVNDDALALQQAATKFLSYADINPFALEAPIAPHIAAKQQHIYICKHDIYKHIQRHMLQAHADILLVEGAGGWHLPLNNKDFMSTVVTELKLNVILVVGMKLGCLNHALLTKDAIIQAGAKLVGWIANEIQPNVSVLAENKAALDDWLQVPCLGFIPFQAKAEEHLTIQPLINFSTYTQQLVPSSPTPRDLFAGSKMAVIASNSERYKI